MGYTTSFKGVIALSRPLTMSEAKTLLEFNEDPDLIEGPHPESYLQWVPTDTLDGLVWDENEKFYNYTEWMQWLVNWLRERGIEAKGELFWSGEETGDVGVITVADGRASAESGRKKGIARGKPMTLAALGEMALAQVTGKE